jgi:putative heme iron utilization protein
LTVTGLAAPFDDARAKARWLALHPYAAFYADFADFSLWRIEPAGFLFVGGFARASRLSRAAMLPDAECVARLAAAEAEIMTHCNNDHPRALDAIARAAGGQGEGWRMVAVDTDGCDLARGERVLRVHFRTPVADAGGVRAELVRLANEARA